MTAQKKTSNKRVRFYAAPNVVDKLKYDWLELGVWDRKSQISRVLEQIGLSGDVTVFQNSANQLTFIQGMKTAFIMHFFSSEEQKLDIAKCSIPNYNREYDHSFAIVQDNSWYFYQLDISRSHISPRFVTTRYNSGFVCKEVLNHSGKIQICFVVERPFGNTIKATISVDNTCANIKAIEDMSPHVLHLLNNCNSKDVYTLFKAIQKLLSSMVSDYVVSNYDENDNITDSIIVTGNQVTTFILSVDDKRITANADGNWTMQSNFYEILKNKEEIQFKSAAKKSDYKKLDKIYSIIEWVEKFIVDNMDFVFLG